MKGILFKLAALSNQKLLILAAVITALYYFLMFDGGSDLDAKIADADSKIQAEQIKAKDSDAALKEVDMVRASVKSLSEKFKDAANQLPTQIDTNDVIRPVTILARSADVNILTMKPGDPRQEDILELIPVHVSGQGNITEIIAFFYWIASMQRISKVANFTISTPNSTESVKFRKGTLLFDGDIISYRYNPQTQNSQGGVK